MEQKAWKIIAITLGVIAILISINALINKNYLLGAVGVVICIGLIILGIKVKVQDIKIPLPVIIANYKAFMEEHFQMSLPKNVNIYFNEEVLDNYVLVLSHRDEDHKARFFPFEANKFTSEFGRGTGQVTTDVREVEFWINKYMKTHKATEELTKRFSDQVAKRIREELEFNKRGEPEEEEAD